MHPMLSFWMLKYLRIIITCFLANCSGNLLWVTQSCTHQAFTLDHLLNPSLLDNICVSNKTVQILQTSNNLKQRLLERGYIHKCLKEAFNRTENSNRHYLLALKKAKPLDGGHRIFTTYSKDHAQVTQICKK